MGASQWPACLSVAVSTLRASVDADAASSPAVRPGVLRKGTPTPTSLSRGALHAAFAVASSLSRAGVCLGGDSTALSTSPGAQQCPHGVVTLLSLLARFLHSCDARADTDTARLLMDALVCVLYGLDGDSFAFVMQPFV
jgi:hypothetical protein